MFPLLHILLGLHTCPIAEPLRERAPRRAGYPTPSHRHAPRGTVGSDRSAPPYHRATDAFLPLISAIVQVNCTTWGLLLSCDLEEAEQSISCVIAPGKGGAGRHSAPPCRTHRPVSERVHAFRGDNAHAIARQRAAQSASITLACRIERLCIVCTRDLLE